MIVGTGAGEYALYQRLEAEGEYRVLFFVGADPWSYRTYIHDAQVRSAGEFAALCANHAIESVFYCDPTLIESLPPVKVPLQQC